MARITSTSVARLLVTTTTTASITTTGITTITTITTERETRTETELLDELQRSFRTELRLPAF